MSAPRLLSSAWQSAAPTKRRSPVRIEAGGTTRCRLRQDSCLSSRRTRVQIPSARPTRPVSSVESERLATNQEVTGSSPVRGSNAPPWLGRHPGFLVQVTGFESWRRHQGFHQRTWPFGSEPEMGSSTLPGSANNARLRKQAKRLGSNPGASRFDSGAAHHFWGRDAIGSVADF